jgi:serine/threonine protein kinase
LKRKLHAKGGLGEVSIATDRELNRDVALKEIQSRFGGDEDAKRRFVFEAEVTGRLEHPGIVPVYAFGSYRDGRPFYAMKFVNGSDLQQACLEMHARGAVDFESSNFRKLLHRFIDVCEAISYAHSRGILHRDIKPGNIMLGDFGETLVVDWGLAKPIAGSASNEEIATNLWFPSEAGATLHGQTVGTPAYMSPEQAEGHLGSLDQRSDVYSLGATLYFMLIGKAPFHGTLLEVLERVKKSEFTPPKTLDSRVPKALSAIVEKAMNNRPEDRYATASAIAKDVEAFLADDPLQALPETWSDRAARFQRKNRKAVLVGSFAAVLIAAGASIAAMLIQQQSRANRTLALREKEAKENAEQLAREKTLLAEAESVAKRLAESRLLQVEKSNELILSIFQDINPDAEEDTPIRSLLVDKLVQAAQPLQEEDFVAPLKRANMQATLAHSILRLGDARSAIPIAENARILFVELQKDNTAEALRNRLCLGEAYCVADQASDALGVLGETISMAKRLDDTDSKLLFSALTANGVAHSQAGELQSALVFHEAALKLAGEKIGENSGPTADAKLNVGVLLSKLQRFHESVPLVERALEDYKRLFGPSHTRTLKAMQHLQLIYMRSGRITQSVDLARQVLRLYQLKLGSKHPDTVAATLGLANMLCNIDAESEAVELLQKAIASSVLDHGVDGQPTLQLQGQLAFALYCQHKYSEALQVNEKTLESMRRSLGPHHHDTIVTAKIQGNIQLALGQRKAAIATWKETLDSARISPGTRASEVMDLMLLYADALSDEGAREEAIVAYLELRDARRRQFGDQDEMSYGVLTRVAWNLIGVNRNDEVVAILNDYVNYRRQKLKDQSHLLASELQYVGTILNEARQWSASEPILREAIALHEKSPTVSWKTHVARFQLGFSLAMQNRIPEAAPMVRNSISGWVAFARNTVPMSEHERELKESVPSLIRNFIACESALGQSANAAAWEEARPDWLEWSSGNRKNPPEIPVVAP